jgi:hypothetical protein
MIQKWSAIISATGGIGIWMWIMNLLPNVKPQRNFTRYADKVKTDKLAEDALAAKKKNHQRNFPN